MKRKNWLTPLLTKTTEHLMEQWSILNKAKPHKIRKLHRTSEQTETKKKSWSNLNAWEFTINVHMQDKLFKNNSTDGKISNNQTPTEWFWQSILCHDCLQVDDFLGVNA